jgi:hypothetical protein
VLNIVCDRPSRTLLLKAEPFLQPTSNSSSMRARRRCRLSTRSPRPASSASECVGDETFECNGDGALIIRPGLISGTNPYLCESGKQPFKLSLSTHWKRLSIVLDLIHDEPRGSRSTRNRLARSILAFRNRNAMIFSRSKYEDLRRDNIHFHRAYQHTCRHLPHRRNTLSQFSSTLPQHVMACLESDVITLIPLPTWPS